MGCRRLFTALSPVIQWRLEVHIMKRISVLLTLMALFLGIAGCPAPQYELRSSGTEEGTATTLGDQPYLAEADTSGGYPLTGQSHVVEPAYGVDRVFPLNIVFVGFDEEAVDTDTIDENIRRDRQFNYGDYSINYSFDLNYHFADSSYYDALAAFVVASSVPDTTSALNVTALEIQKDTGQRMSIFTSQSGRAVDAVAVEDWLAANPLNADLEPAYWFYVINFTELDPVDPESRHWYAVTAMDLEAGRMRDFWTPTEFDNPLNRGVGFPYACFTSQSRVFLIDPSAHQWYLTWARIWWGLTETGPEYEYYESDLAGFLDAHDVYTPEGRSALAYYLAGWIEDGVVNLLAPRLYPSTSVLNAHSLSLQTIILNNSSDSGYDNETMRWIVDSELYQYAIKDLVPWMDVEVVFEFANLEDYPELQTIFEDAVIEEQNGWTYYDLRGLQSSLRGAREAYFDFKAADLVVNGYVLLEKAMSARAKWNGEEAQGIGGGGQLLVMREVSRYFDEDGVTPRFGLGSVFIHEAGHNLGLPHTFTRNAYAGDFAFDVMGYYSPSYFFTQLWKDCFRRLVVDFRLLSQQERLDETMGAYELRTPAPAIEAEFAKAYTRIDEVNALYGQLRFLDAYDKILELEESVVYVEYLIDTPLWLAHVSSTEGGSVAEPGEGGFAYEDGAVIDLVAEPDPGYRFVNWTGDVGTVGDVEAGTTSIIIRGEYSITANFEPVPSTCFIATAAYGTPMAAEVQILREFRDGYLLTNLPGQTFVDFYYSVSPTIAEVITEHPVLKPIVRAGLVPAVVVSSIVVNDTPFRKAGLAGFLVLVSVTLAVWAARRRGQAVQHA